MVSLNLLRKAGIAEGLSFLVLLLIAMPLKYFFQLPMAVKVVGWLHGILFVGFLVMAFEFRSDKKLSYKWLALAFLAALIPLGTFFFDKELKKLG